MQVQTQEVVLLKDAYYRRLLNINQEIRLARKQKLGTKDLNESRKAINKKLNLLVEMVKTNINEKLYNELLEEYKHD
jgi:hypothetical protein